MPTPIRNSTRTGRPTGRPSRGPRAEFTARLALPVLHAADVAAAERGIDRSMFLADHVVWHYGRPELMQALSQQQLITCTYTDDGTRGISHSVKVRVPEPVAELVRADVARLGITRPTLLGDIIAVTMGFPQFVREYNTTDRKGQLPLAI